jgi:hypothetical protein
LSDGVRPRELISVLIRKIQTRPDRQVIVYSYATESDVWYAAIDPGDGGPIRPLGRYESDPFASAEEHARVAVDGVAYAVADAARVSVD